MTEGDRIVREEMGEPVGAVMLQIAPRIARRIDAALAEREAQIARMSKWYCEVHAPEADDMPGCASCAAVKERKLREQAEAQIAALREALTGPSGLLEFLQAQASCEDKSYWRLQRWAQKRGLFIDDLSEHRAFVEMAKHAMQILDSALTDTRDAARAFVERIQQGTRERARELLRHVLIARAECPDVEWAVTFEQLLRDVEQHDERIQAEERERIAKYLQAHAERLKHTSHRDGLGMGWQAGELLCEELAAAIRALPSRRGT